MKLASYTLIFIKRFYLKILKEYSKEFGSDLNDRMAAFVDNGLETFFEDAQLPRSDFKVIIHGDLWYSNFMFR